MHVKPKKYLGQNFLVDPNIRRKIICSCSLKTSDIVLELGAGRGELTQGLAETAHKVFALEIDSNLCRVLKYKFKDKKNIKIINQDILKLNISRAFAKEKVKIKVVGNIPYYITTPLIEHLFEYKNKIEAIYLTVQKEFAQRIVAQPGACAYGAFSCFVQFHSQAKVNFFIKKNSFWPAPKIDSAFLTLQPLVYQKVKTQNKSLFFKIIRTAFNHRRKTLRNSLKGIVSQEKLKRYFEKYAIRPDIRPEQLALEDFAALIKV